VAPSILPFGLFDGGDRDLAAHVLQRQALGDELGRIDLDADRRLLLAADRDLRDAGDLADLLRQLGIVGVVSTVVSGSVSTSPTAAGSASPPD
jgi:hypothetical protein